MRGIHIPDSPTWLTLSAPASTCWSVEALPRSWRNQGNALQGLSLAGNNYCFDFTPFCVGGMKREMPMNNFKNCRYVRTGTAASPHVLQILRKKIEQRLKLKELLGGDHVFFGGIKNIKASPSKAKKKV